MATMNISLPQQMRDWIESCIASGAYANASDYMRDLVREHQKREMEYLEYLRKAIKEGEESGISKRSFDEIISEAKRKIKSKNG